MRKLTVFNFTTLNGYFKGPGDDTSWHSHDEEGSKFAQDALGADGILLFGRKTYDMMASFWPTDNAKQMMPEVAEGMNKSEKIVFSKTLKQATWENTRIISDNIIEEVRKLKNTPGKDMAILGSGSITTLFAQHGLIDEYQLMIDPLLIGSGSAFCQGLNHVVELKLTQTKIFKSGRILACYAPAK